MFGVLIVYWEFGMEFELELVEEKGDEGKMATTSDSTAPFDFPASSTAASSRGSSTTLDPTTVLRRN